MNKLSSVCSAKELHYPEYPASIVMPVGILLCDKNRQDCLIVEAYKYVWEPRHKDNHITIDQSTPEKPVAALLPWKARLIDWDIQNEICWDVTGTVLGWQTKEACQTFYLRHEVYLKCRSLTAVRLRYMGSN